MPEVPSSENKRGFGHHPLWVFADHGQQGTGEPLAVLLRPGNAGSNTAADHITVVAQALLQLPGTRRGKHILIRADGAGCTHEFLAWLTKRRRTVGFTLPDSFTDMVKQIPKAAWTPAYDADGDIRPGAWIADVTALLNLTQWPPGMRVIVRKERAHPGAQLRITDLDGHRFTAFATNTTKGQLAALELRHRRRARCEDRIRCAKDTGLTNLPLHDLDQNKVWCAIVTLALELTAWLQMLALTGNDARRWEPKRLRLRLFAIAGRLAHTGRRVHLHLSRHAPWAEVVLAALSQLQAANPVT